MTLAGDSILVTPGSGATVATHTVASKEHQAVMIADAAGHIDGSRNMAMFVIPSQVHVAVASTIHWALFNGFTDVIRVHSIRQIPNITTAVTGVVFDWVLQRCTSTPTGGTQVFPEYADNSGGSWFDNAVVLRSKPTGGAAISSVLRNYSLSSEETNAATIQIASEGGLELVPEPVRKQGLVLRNGDGLRCVQSTSSAAGNTGWLIVASSDAA